MASGPFSSSKETNYIELMMNSQQDLNLELPTSLDPSQHHQIVSMEQSNEATLSHPNADIVIEVSPTTLVDGKLFICPLCYKGFKREQNLTLHRRVHNLPFHLKAETPKGPIPRKMYLCPEPTCINHNRCNALGDFGGLKKHYLRKHSTNKKHKCDRCSKMYAVASDLKAHLRTCAPKKYNCECGARFSSQSKLNHHQELCDPQLLANAAKNKPISDLRNNNSLGSIGYNNITTSISPITTPYLPSSYMGNNSSRIISNLSNNSLFGSTTPYIPIPPMGSNNNNFNINNSITDSTMSHLLGPSNVFSVASTQENQFQENTGIGYFTNLMMNIEDTNMNTENTSFMGYGSHYETGEGSNLFSGSASGANITPNMVQGFAGSSSGQIGGFSMGEEYYSVPFGTPNFVTNSDYNMVQPYGSFSTGGGGSFMPQEHLSIAGNNGVNNMMNSLQGSNYYGNYDGGSGHVAGNEVLNSETLPTTGEVAPYEEQYWNNGRGIWF